MPQNNNQFDIQYIEYKIKNAQENGEAIDTYVLRAINWLQSQLDLFLENSKVQGKDIETDYDIADIEIRQYAAMKQLAQEASLPTEPYDEKIKQVQIRIFGEENWENFFGNDN